MIIRYCLLALASAPAAAQMSDHDMTGMTMPTTKPGTTMPGMATTMDKAAATTKAADAPAMPGMAMTGMATGMAMTGMLGPYPMTREASGTSWQPEAASLSGAHFDLGGWSLMVHGNVTSIYDDQGGPRGDQMGYATSMLMVMAQRPVGDGDTLGLRAMMSLDPLIGKRGYPLLFATGETADGHTELVDRQHPHDLVMELAATYSHDLGDGRAVSLYAGLPGEPALGPPAFMHRSSGMDIPEAPIGHHWFDSTHITYGVVTAGYATSHWKLETSAFKGREPDQYRYDIETPKLDSWSVRGFWNPSPNWSIQASTGHLHSPEQLHPDQNEQRTTVSGSYTLGRMAATLAYAVKDLEPGPRLNGLLAEATFSIDRKNTVFARAEREDEDELFAQGPLHDTIIPVAKASIGYFRTLPLSRDLALDLGGLASAYAYPDRIKPAYGSAGIKSFMIFARFKLGD